MDDRFIAAWRLHTLRLVGHTYPSATEAVRGLLGVQAENFAQTGWALACRTPGMTESEFHTLFNDGEILRTHVLRPTWHFATREDLPWLLTVTEPRVRRTYEQLRRQHALDDAALAAAHDVIRASLSGGAHRTRGALAEQLRDAGLPAEGMQLSTILADAELSGLICSGPLDGKEQTYALLEERAPSARRPDRDEALAELALRYFTGHGPATERDLAYWATLTVTDVRSGLAHVSDQLGSLEHEGKTYWFAGEPPTTTGQEPRAHLLLIFDEYFRGYQDSRYVLDTAGLVTRGRTATIGMVLVDSQMVGDMRRSVTGETVTFDIRLFRDLDAGETDALHETAERYGAFLGCTPVLNTTRA